MANITASLVKELRETTGAGMMDCKKALQETDGDMSKAVDYLREKGIAKAEKKAGRIAAEGAVVAYVSEDAKLGVLLEVNCETDFAAGNEQFRELEAKLAAHIAHTKPENLEVLNESVLDGKKVSELVTEATATIGEKISLRRFVLFESEGRISSYIHMGGKIGVLVNLSDGAAELGKDIAMQVAASSPSAVDRSGISAEVLNHEKEILRKQALEEGKPEKIVDRMVEGRIGKYYQEVCLLEQSFIKDPDKTIADVLGDTKVIAFERFKLGEGIEKKQEDFAAEVAAQMK